MVSENGQKLEDKMNSFSYSKYPIFINHEKSETPTMKDVMKETPADITEDFTNAYHDNDDETIVEALLIAPDDVVVDEKFYEKVLNVDNYEPVSYTHLDVYKRQV